MFDLNATLGVLKEEECVNPAGANITLLSKRVYYKRERQEQYEKKQKACKDNAQKTRKREYWHTFSTKKINEYFTSSVKKKKVALTTSSSLPSLFDLWDDDGDDDGGGSDAKLITDSIYTTYLASNDGKVQDQWYLQTYPSHLNDLVLPFGVKKEFLKIEEDLKRSLDDGCNGKPTCVFISGPNGCGKTACVKLLGATTQKLSPLEDFSASDIHIAFSKKIYQQFLSRTVLRPFVVVSDVEKCEYGNELRQYLDTMRGTGLIIIECNDRFCGFMKSVARTKLAHRCMELTHLNPLDFGQACTKSIENLNKNTDRTVTPPPPSVLDAIYPVCCGDVRSGITRLEIIWNCDSDCCSDSDNGCNRNRRHVWPQSLEETDTILSKMDHNMNTFSKVKLLCKSQNMENWTNRAMRLVDDDAFTARVVSENVADILKCRGISRDIGCMSRMLDLVSDSQMMLSITRDTEHATTVGCVAAMYEAVSGTHPVRALYPRMPSILNAFKQEKENRNIVKYVADTEMCAQTKHTVHYGGLGLEYTVVRLNIGPFEPWLRGPRFYASLMDWVRLQNANGKLSEKDKALVLPKDVATCFAQTISGTAKKTKRKGVLKLVDSVKLFIGCDDDGGGGANSSE